MTAINKTHRLIADDAYRDIIRHQNKLTGLVVKESLSEKQYKKA